MNPYGVNPTPIDELLRDGEDHTIIFAYDVGTPVIPDGDTQKKARRTGRGVNAALGKMAQVLPCVSALMTPEDDTWKRVRYTGCGVNGALAVMAQILVSMSKMDFDVPDIAVKIDAVSDEHVNARFAELIREIILDTEKGRLDLNAPLEQEMLDLAGVPREEPRRTVGALVYYYVKHLASRPMIDPQAVDRVVLAAMPKAYVIIKPIE